MADLILTRPQWLLIREALAAAQIFAERVTPALKRSHVTLDKQTRHIVPQATRAIGSGFNLMLELSQGDDTADDFVNSDKVRVQPEIDVKLMRAELDDCAALNLGDIAYELIVAAHELPAFAKLVDESDKGDTPKGQLCAALWEAGRRYGVTEALALFDATADEYTNSVRDILTKARDRNLEITAAMSAEPAHNEGSEPTPLRIVEAPGAQADDTSPFLN